MRQQPRAVRRAVLDGVAPPDMLLPASFSTDGQAALEQALAACEAEPDCAARHPALRQDLKRLLAGLPREVALAHPFTGTVERFVLTRETLLALLRGPLYAPPLAAALPQALHEAAQGRLEPLAALTLALGGGGRGAALAAGMHFSVVCAEDVARLEQGAAADAPGADFGDSYQALYRDVCAGWPRGAVPAAFYTLPPAPAATLLLSGGADPATPPRHGQRVAQALGALARHEVVPQAGHGTLAIPCLRDAVHRFIDAPDDAAALAVDTGCARAIPRPPSFALPRAEAAAAAAAGGAR